LDTSVRCSYPKTQKEYALIEIIGAIIIANFIVSIIT